MYPIDLFFRQAARTPEAIALEFARRAGDIRGSRRARRSAGGRATVLGSGAAVARRHLLLQPHRARGGLARRAGRREGMGSLYPKNRAAEIGLGISFTEASIVIADATALPLVEGAGAAILVADTDGGAGTTGGLVRAHEGAAPRFHALHSTRRRRSSSPAGLRASPKE